MCVRGKDAAKDGMTRRPAGRKEGHGEGEGEGGKGDDGEGEKGESNGERKEALLGATDDWAPSHSSHFYLSIVYKCLGGCCLCGGDGTGQVRAGQGRAGGEASLWRQDGGE